MTSGRWLPLLVVLAGVAVVALLSGRSGSPEAEPAPSRAKADAEPPPSRREVFHSPLAGRWYPADPQRLADEIDGMLARAVAQELAPVRALVQPHAGYRWSGAVACTGLRRLRGRTIRRVIALGPCHYAGQLGMENVASVPRATHYATPLGEVALDTALIAELLRYPCFQHIPYAHAQEHSVQIQLPLLQRALESFLFVPVVVGALDEQACRTIAAVLRPHLDEETLLVVSTDFTHYGPNYHYVPFGLRQPERVRELDMGAYERIRSRDLPGFREYVARTGATICGRCAVGVLLALLGPDMDVHLLKYDTSGHLSGDTTNSVSYFSIAFTGSWPESAGVPKPGAPMPLSSQDRTLLLQLARRTLEYALRHEEVPTLEDLGMEEAARLSRPAGVFVTITKGEQEELRGCRGQIYATSPLHRAVVNTTVDSALRDYRFEPCDKEELPELHLDISVLTEPREVASLEEIEVGRHGIILEKEGRRALFLPQVAPRQGWDLPETLSHLARKAGLADDAWKTGARFQVFEAEVFAEDRE